MEKKLVAILNEKVETGKLMNALAHMSLGLGGSHEKREELKLIDYKDAEQGIHQTISEIPFIILKTNSTKIRNLRKMAINENIKFVDFTDTMTVGTAQQQLERTLQTKEEDLIYFGIVLFGDYEIINEWTKKLSLFR